MDKVAGLVRRRALLVGATDSYCKNVLDLLENVRHSNFKINISCAFYEFHFERNVRKRETIFTWWQKMELFSTSHRTGKSAAVALNVG